MQRRLSMILRTTSLAGTATALLALFPLVGWTPAIERVKVSGRHIMTMTQQQSIVGDRSGHVLMLSEAKGTNESTGSTTWMQGSTLLSVGTADLVFGSGSQQGYIVEVENGDTAYARWSGMVTTVLSKEKVPITTFGGQWTKFGGSGRFKGLSGAGIYKGRFTSPTEYTMEWSGEAELPAGYTSAR
jgi:hypothetical protein